MNNSICNKVFLLFFVVFISFVSGKNSDEFEPRNAAMFRLISSGLSDEKVDGYTAQVQTTLQEMTGWDILNYQVTTTKIREQGGDWFCSKADCAIVNGQFLNVDYVIFGTVQTIGKSMAISIQIADVNTGRIVSDVSKFYSGKESNFVRKIIPEVSEQLAVDVRTIRMASRDRIEKGRLSTQKEVAKQSKGKFNDMRGYFAYTPTKNAASSISAEGKMAFGYLMIGANMSKDDILRYSYQLQSYLSLIGAHAMLYIDEMELLMQVRGGELRCRDRKTAKVVGRLLGVDVMGYGKISRVGKNFFIKTSIVDVETGTVIKKAIKGYRGREDVFLTEVIPDIAQQLGNAFDKFKKINYNDKEESAYYRY